MLRWLKDKKKSKKTRPDTPDDYGFKQQRLSQADPQTEEGYDEKVYHIYEEIPDIPTPVPGPDFLNESFSNGFRHDTHHHQHQHHHQHHQHHHQQRTNDGPYMVVPIVGSQSQETGGHRGGCPLESRSAFSLVSEGEGRTAFTCAVIGRRRSCDRGSLATSSEPYEFTTGSSSDGGRGSISDGPDAQNPPELPLRPWETTRTTSKVLSSTSSSSIGTSSTASGHSVFGSGMWTGDSNGCHIRFLKRPVALPAADPCQGSPDRKCCGGGCSAHAHAHGRRHDPARDCDSCYEYDVSTSSESEQYNYEFYLNKVEENLMMKHKVQQIILTMEKSRQQKKSGCSRGRHCSRKMEGNESDDDCSAFRPPKKCQHRDRCGQVRCCNADPDEGTLADQSESENSSGYYESFSLADATNATASGSSSNSRRDSSSCCREKSREMISHHRGLSCPTSCKCSGGAVSTRKAPVCGVRSLNMGHRREKSVDSGCKLLTQQDEVCTGLNSCSGSCGGARSCERARKRSCSREDGPLGERQGLSGVQGHVTTRCEAGQRGESNPHHKHCHSTARQLRELSAREASSSSSSSNKEVGVTVAMVHRDAEKDSNVPPAEAATTSSSSGRKEKSKKDRSHSKPHKKHRHRSSSKPRKNVATAAPEPAEDVNDDYEVPGSNPGEGLDTREVEEDYSEVYTPPPSVSDFVSRVAVPQPKMSCKAWKQDSSEIYSSRSRSNRLLSDLIVSNYDRQLFVRV